MEDNKDQVMNEEALSKAIDELIDEHFGKSEEDVSKSNQPSAADLDQLPKEEDVNANGGKDVIKAKKSEEEDEEEEEAEKAKSCNKSFNSDDIEIEELRKSFNDKTEDFSKSVLALAKSVSLINEKLDSAGEIFKGLKYEIDQLKKSPTPRKSIRSVDQINKSFVDVEDQGKEEKFSKSEVETAIESLVKSGRISSSIGTEYEMYGKIGSPHARQVVISEVMRKHK